ncbi:MAG: AAA family ATPase [Terriglobales bacterium]
MGSVDASTKLALIGVCLDPGSYNSLAHFLMSMPAAVPVANLDHYVGAEREVARALDPAQSRICVIDYDHNSDEAIWITERLHAEQPDVYVFAASANPDPERIIAAMRAGCTEFLLKPLQHDRVVDAFARVEAKQKQRSRSKVRGKVITLVGAKGGTGVTTLALHLALQLSGAGKRKCILVDQHPALGDVSLYLGTGRHQYSFYELASNTDRLDQELLQGFLLTHESGLHLLDSPEALDAIHYAPPAAVEQTLTFLAETYDFVLVDCPPGLTDATLACIAQSDQVAVVITAELPSVRNTVRYLEHLAKLGYDAGKVTVVLNRCSKKGPLTEDSIEKALRRKIGMRIPNSYAEVIRAINSGVPIASGQKSEFAAAMYSWAQVSTQKETAEKTKTAAAGSSRGGVLGLFGK